MSLKPRWPRELLYFPLINPPRHVINHALMYWENLATIAPDGPSGAYLREDMRMLVDEGFARTIPMLSVWDEEVKFGEPPPPSANGFVLANEVLDRLAEFSQGRRQLLRPISHISSAVLQASWTDPDFGTSGYAKKPGGLAVLAGEKFPRDFLEALIDEGLARYASETEAQALAHATPPGVRGVQDAWLYSSLVLVAPPVQTALMSIVTPRVAAKHHVIPHTDSPSAWCLALGPEYQTPQITRRGHTPVTPTNNMEVSEIGAAWQLELGNLLPVPSPRTPVDKVLAFRRNYDDERQRLIIAVRKLINDLESATNDPAEVFDAVERELRVAMADLQGAARGNRLGVVRRSVAATFAIAASAAAHYVPGLSWVLGVVSGFTVNIATTNTSTDWQTSPYAFLHKVKRRSSGRPGRLNPIRRRRTSWD